MLKIVLNRPITVIMFFITILIIGLISFYKIPLELKPSTEYPQLTISATWRNASPETIEGKITSPIEAEVSSLNNIYKITSTSNLGWCNITIQYLRNSNMNFAYMNLNERLSIIKKDLPKDVRNSLRIRKYVPREFSKTTNLLTYKIYGDMKLYEVYQYAEDNIKNSISSINGVSNVEISGASGREIKILIDKNKANSLGISSFQIRSKIREYGKQSDAGIIRKSGREFNLLINNKISSAGELRNIFIANSGNVPVLLKDIAKIDDTLGDNLTINRINGVSTVTMTIEKESGANAIDVADAIIAKITELEENFPANMNIEMDSDSTKEMREQLSDIKKRGLFSLLVITIILLLFLRDIKTPFIILSTIIFSLLITFIFLYFTGYTLNVVTLSGLALGLGMLVDNSIVVIENIYQYYKKGYSKFESALRGTREVMLPIIASTLTTIVVFLPFLFLSGDKKLRWVPLAIAVCLSLFSSLIVSFSLTPTLTNLMLKKRPENGKIIKHSDLQIKNNMYHTLLKGMINNKVMSILFVGIFFYFSYYMFDKYVDKGEIWSWGRNDVVSLYIGMPTGSTVEMTDDIIKKFEKQINRVGGFEKFNTRIGRNWRGTFANISIHYSEEDMKSLKPFTMEEELTAIARNFQGPLISVHNPLNTSGGYRAGGTTSKQYSNTFAIKGYNYNELKKYTKVVRDYLLKNKRINDVDINSTSHWRTSDLFNFVFRINRAKLAVFNTTVQNLLYFIIDSTGGNRTENLVINGKETPYSVKYNDYKDFNVEQLKDLIYKYGSTLFRIKEIGEIIKEPMMTEISKEDQAYTRLIKFDYRGTPKSANAYQQNLMDNYKLPPGYSFEERERNFMSEEEENEVKKILLLSIILVFMVTASLFESLWHPFVVILTVPLGLIGVFLIFFFMDKSFNQDAYMGAILLAGIAVNNSIILINHINDLRKEKLNLLRAIVIGTSQRVRPILMTTATTVIGILPLIVASEASENFWYTLSITTVGGLIASTAFVLTIVPVLYAAVERIKGKIKGYTAT